MLYNNDNLNIDENDDIIDDIINDESGDFESEEDEIDRIVEGY